MYFGPPVTGLQNAELQDVARAVFYFRRDVKTTTEYHLYSVLSMLAEIGGYVGLLLGVSLFKLAEINNAFIDWYVENKVVVEDDSFDDVKGSGYRPDKSSGLNQSQKRSALDVFMETSTARPAFHM